MSRRLSELRPPDLRHLDAAFSSLSASPLGESSLRLSINDFFATRCATCGRTLPVDEVEWLRDAPAKLHYRCLLCRDQQGRSELQVVDAGEMDRTRAPQDVVVS